MPTPDADDPAMPLYGAWKTTPGPKTLTPLLQHLDPIIDKALGAYGYSNDSAMKSTARVLAIKSLPKFDPKRAQLGTFVFGELRRLQRVGPQQEFAISVPERVLLDRAAVRRASDELRERLGREPTDDELMDNTGVSRKRLMVLRAVPSQTVGPRVDDEGNTIPDVAGVADNRELWAEAVRLSLDPVDQKIQAWSSGVYGERLSKQEMARRLGISPAAVTQRAQRIAQKLADGEGITL